MAMKILIDAPEAAELEPALRRVLESAEGQAWVLSVVKQQPTWTVNVLVSPEAPLWGWNYVGPARELPGAVAGALAAAGLREFHRP
jgi:hypothetical protein